MPDTCTNDCPLIPRVEALERANEQHSKTHEGMFDRLRTLETSDAVQNAHYKAIDAKLDELTVMVKDLSGKAGKRWESMVDKALWLLVGGVLSYLLLQMGVPV